MLIITKLWGTQEKEDVTKAGCSHHEEMEVAQRSHLSSWRGLKSSPNFIAREMALQNAASSPIHWGLLIDVATAWSKHEPDVPDSVVWAQQIDHELRSAATHLNNTQALPSRAQGATSGGLGSSKGKKL